MEWHAWRHGNMMLIHWIQSMLWGSPFNLKPENKLKYDQKWKQALKNTLSITKSKERTIIFNTLSFIHITFILHWNIQLESNQVTLPNINIVKKMLNIIIILFTINLQAKLNYTAKHKILKLRYIKLKHDAEANLGSP